MKIDKINSQKIQKSRTNASQRNQDLTSFGLNENNREAAYSSKVSSNTIKNNFLSGISFKGHSKEIKRKTIGTAGAIAIGRDPGYSDYSTNIPEKIRSDESSFPNSSIESTIFRNQYETNRIYFADPEEVVGPQTKKDHDYIVYDNRPHYPRLEAIRENYYNTEKNANNYGQDFKTIAEYYYRLEKADLLELNRLKEERNKIKDEYETSLEYKRTFEEKKEKFPWNVEQINKDKEQADYFFKINSDKYENLNQKIGYYSDRINHSKEQQQKAIQAFNLFDEVGLMFFDRDNMQLELNHKRYGLKNSIDAVTHNKKLMEDFQKQEEDISTNLKTIREWKALNDKKAAEKVINPDHFPYNERWERKKEAEEQSREIHEARSEAERLQRKIQILELKLEKVRENITEGKGKIKAHRENIEKLMKEIPQIQRVVNNKSEQIKFHYPKMEEFYKNNIEEWQY